MSIRKLALVLGLFVLLSAAAQAKPATTLKITDTTTFSGPSENPWFIRADLGTDLAFKGATGIGASAGHMGEFMFYDFAFSFMRANYGALRVYQTGVTGNSPLNPNSELGRPRSDSDTDAIFTIGGGVGFMFKFLGSEDWVEIGRFGLNFANFQDTTNNMTFRGPLMNFHAEMGYRLTKTIMLAPGATYNLGYVTRVGAGTSTATTVSGSDDLAHNKFLPIQWWSWQASFYFFL